MKVEPFHRVQQPRGSKSSFRHLPLSRTAPACLCPHRSGIVQRAVAWGSASTQLFAGTADLVQATGAEGCAGLGGLLPGFQRCQQAQEGAMVPKRGRETEGNSLLILALASEREKGRERERERKSCLLSRPAAGASACSWMQLDVLVVDKIHDGVQ